jgi:hypothetical protein
LNIWIDENFYSNKKIKRLILELGAEAIICLHRLWFYANKYAVDNLLDEDKIGILKDCDDDDIELIAEWSGERGIFTNLLKSLKLLDYKYGQYFVHDFNDHNPQLIVYIKQKINGSKYARRRWENKQKADLMGDPLTDPNSDLMAIEKKRKEKKRIKEKINKKKGSSIELPEWLNKEVWNDWVQHRKQKRNKLTDKTIERQIKLLEKHKDIHVAILEYSIQNGYQGLFPDKVKPEEQIKKRSSCVMTDEEREEFENRNPF